MTPLVYVFMISGLGILGLLVAKKIEEKRRKPLFVLAALSRSNIYVREVYQHVVHWYSDGKENFSFIVEKQIPMHTVNYKNKLISFLKEKRDEYTNNMRDTRLLRRSDGISEFFQSISNVEKVGGEIHDSLEHGSQKE
jgi:hypothetical protein